jgi:hypothetical protein
MNCKKCNSPMKEYLGLKETGWDCVNQNCNKTVSIITLPEAAKISDIVNITFKPVPVPSDDYMDALRYITGLSFPETATGEQLNYIAKSIGLDIMCDETDEDFRFRLLALLDGSNDEN